MQELDWDLRRVYGSSFTQVAMEEWLRRPAFAVTAALLLVVRRSARAE
jgi:hypothetical protein